MSRNHWPRPIVQPVARPLLPNEGLSRWFVNAGGREQALELMRRAVKLGLPDELLFRTLWDTALLEKRLGRQAAALEVLDELASGRNPYRAAALEELAKHFEHREKDYARALELVRQAIAVADSVELRQREARLERRLSKPRLL